MTYTYVEMPVSKATYDEIRLLLKAASYDHAIGEEGELDMRGIALIMGAEPAPETSAALEELQPVATREDDILSKIEPYIQQPIEIDGILCDLTKDAKVVLFNHIRRVFYPKAKIGRRA